MLRQHVGHREGGHGRKDQRNAVHERWCTAPAEGPPRGRLPIGRLPLRSWACRSSAMPPAANPIPEIRHRVRNRSGYGAGLKRRGGDPTPWLARPLGGGARPRPPRLRLLRRPDPVGQAPRQLRNLPHRRPPHPRMGPVVMVGSQLEAPPLAGPKPRRAATASTGRSVTLSQWPWGIHAGPFDETGGGGAVGPGETGGEVARAHAGLIARRGVAVPGHGCRLGLGQGRSAPPWARTCGCSSACSTASSW